MTDSELYRAFGEGVAKTGNTRNPYRFQGQAGPYTDATNRVWMRARIYDPETWQWYSVDPIGHFGEDYNLYRFVMNNSVNWVDPEGLRIGNRVGIEIEGPGGNVYYGQPTTTPSASSKPDPKKCCLDERSEKNLRTLLPAVQERARCVVCLLNVKASAQEKRFVITSGSRTFKEQNELYAQGRTKPGKIVTYARAGYSNHNFQSAIDVTLFKGKNPVWEGAEYRWGKEVAIRCGMEWGKLEKDRSSTFSISWC